MKLKRFNGLSMKMCLAAMVLICTSCAGFTKSTPVTATQTLAERVIPAQADQLVFKIIRSNQDADVFEISGQDGKVVIAGNNAVSLAAGLNWYLKHVCNCQVSWNGDQLNLPAKLSAPTTPIRKESPYQWRHYYNYCTFSYTMAFKDWNDWQREIDLMALRGTNMALVLPGHELVWQNVLKRLDYSDEDIAAFIPTSAHTAWWLMGNLEGIDGVVPQDVIEGEAELGRKIISRMRELGIEPIVNSFFGMVPTTFKKYYPDANIIPQGIWGGCVRPEILSPLDPMFPKVAKIWYEELEKVYGKVTFFGGDLFHEGGRSDDLPVGECALSVQREMLKYNPAAVWIMQSWQDNPKPAMLQACDQKHLLVQQLAYSVNDWEKRGYWKQLRTFENTPWTFSFILNFGGSEGMHGNLRALAKVPEFLNRRQDLKDCIGYGVLCEGLRVNPVNYDMLSDLAWTDQSPDVDQWLTEYVHHRYGKPLPKAEQAWRLLEQSIYRFDEVQEGQTDSILCAIPSKTVKKARRFTRGTINYSKEDVLKAAELLYACRQQLSDRETYTYDLVDTTRQVLQNYARQLHPEMIAAYEAGNKAEFEKLSKRFLELIDDTDRLLSTDRYFLLGNWLADARAKASDKSGKDLMEHSGRYLITQWKRDGKRTLSDYASRQWAGLMKDYYKPRWAFFIDSLNKSLNDPERAAAIEKEYEDQLPSLEKEWIETTGTAYATQPSGDPVKTAGQILDKYAPFIRESLKKEN